MLVLPVDFLQSLSNSSEGLHQVVGEVVLEEGETKVPLHNTRMLVRRKKSKHTKSVF